MTDAYYYYLIALQYKRISEEHMLIVSLVIRE